MRPDPDPCTATDGRTSAEDCSIMSTCVDPRVEAPDTEPFRIHDLGILPAMLGVAAPRPDKDL